MSRLVCIAVVAALTTCPALAQAPTPPSPGPTNPQPPPSAITKPGSDLVVNPTDAECKKGWDPGLKWTKDQFDKHCATMRAAK
jgi:hypothetical protein